MTDPKSSEGNWNINVQTLNDRNMTHFKEIPFHFALTLFHTWTVDTLNKSSKIILTLHISTGKKEDGCFLC